MDKTKGDYLATENVGKLIKRFAIPSVIALLVSSIYNMVDQVFIGWGIGYLGNGATSVVYPITVFALALAIMVGNGAAAYFSIQKGRGDMDKVHKCVGNAIILLITLGIMLSALCFIFKEQLLTLFGVTHANYEYASQYYNIIAFGLTFSVSSLGVSAIIRADGSPKYSMQATIIGAVINLILDPIAIFVLDMGMVGAGIATITGQFVSAIYGLWYFRNMKSTTLTKSSFKFDKKLAIKISTLGISSFVTQISIVVFLAVLNQTMVKYGGLSVYGEDIPLTVMGIIMKIYQVATAFVVGISIGAQPVVGYNMGAGNYSRMKEIYKTIIKMQVICCLIITAVLQLLPVQIISLFGSESELYNEFAVLAIRVFLSTMVLGGVVKASSIFMQGMGKPVSAIIISTMRDIIVPSITAVTLAYFFGVKGALLSYPIADIITIIAAFFVVRKTMKWFDCKIEKSKDSDTIRKNC
ncbi:MAG: MATE family efflux transporter [Bacillota bacterium]